MRHVNLFRDLEELELRVREEYNVCDLLSRKFPKTEVLERQREQRRG